MNINIDVSADLGAATDDCVSSPEKGCPETRLKQLRNEWRRKVD